MNNEPSVLDFVKWLFSFKWNQPLEIPSDRRESNELDEAGLAAQKTEIEPEEPISLQTRLKRLDAALPWRIILAVLLGLTAQIGLEPPRQYENPSFFILFLYFLAAFFAVWGVVSREWEAPEIEEGSKNQMNTSVRWISLLVGLVAIPIAMIAFSGNTFNEVNLFLWVLCLLYVVLAFWHFPGQDLPGRIKGQVEKIKGFFQESPILRIRLTPLLILLVLAIGLVIFFRTSQLEQVPGEMWSDQAEKLLDVNDVLKGQHSIFFFRNTGREAFQIYVTALVAQISGMDLGFLALKLGTMLAGLVTLIYMYRLSRLTAGPWVALAVVLLAGVAYWPNLISRVGLRYAFYPLFVAPLMFYLVRGIQRSNRNDIIKAGIALGMGLHGYSAFRIAPFLVLLAFGLFLLHKQSENRRKQTLASLGILVLVSLVVFLPLLTFALEFPEAYSARAFSRLVPQAPTEKPIPQILLENTWNASIMFFWDNGEIWVHSIPGRPALDVVTAVMYFLGLILVLLRYLKQRSWVDIFLLLSIPVLLLPSILSVAFPNENPSLNRTAGAYIPVFLFAGIGLEALGRGLMRRANQWKARLATGAFVGFLILFTLTNNYSLVFDQYNNRFKLGVWNTVEMGQLIRDFSDSVGSPDTAYVVPYPYWVDTRLVGINSGDVEKDYALWPENFDLTINDPRTKMFLLKADDTASLEKLLTIYPNASYSLRQNPDLPGKDYYILIVPARPGQNIP